MTRRLIVEADGGSRGNPGPAAFGALVKDADTGELLSEVAEVIGTATNNVAEYRGLVAALEAAGAVDPAAEIEVRMDSKLVIEQMAGRWRIKHPDLQPLALAARRLIPNTRITWTWIPREQNTHADRLVNEVLDRAKYRQPVIDEAEVEPPPAAVQPPSQSAAGNRLVGWAELGSPTTFLLVRHGETVHTQDKKFSGAGAKEDPGLTPLGFDQAKRAAAGLASRGGISAVFASPLRRARETAEVIAEALNLAVLIEEDFRECAFGDWNGLTFTQVRESWPRELADWLASTEVAPPGGESFDSVSTRVAAARDRLLESHSGDSVAVVSHVTPIKTLVRLALDAPPNALYRMELAPASLTEIQYYADGIASLRAFSVIEKT